MLLSSFCRCHKRPSTRCIIAEGEANVTFFRCLIFALRGDSYGFHRLLCASLKFSYDFFFQAGEKFGHVCIAFLGHLAASLRRHAFMEVAEEQLEFDAR